MARVSFSEIAQDVVVQVSSDHPLATVAGFAIPDSSSLDGSTVLLLGSALEALLLRVAHAAPDLDLCPLGSAMVNPGFLVDQFDALHVALGAPLPQRRAELPVWLSHCTNTFEVDATHLYPTLQFFPSSAPAPAVVPGGDVPVPDEQPDVGDTVGSAWASCSLTFGLFSPSSDNAELVALADVALFGGSRMTAHARRAGPFATFFKLLEEIVQPPAPAMRAAAVARYLCQSVWPPQFVSFSGRTQPGVELTDRLLVAKVGDPRADVVYAQRCLWIAFPVLKDLFKGLAPDAIVLHVAELARASGMIGSAWASGGLSRLEARVSSLSNRLASDASIDTQVASLARALGARPSGSSVGPSAQRLDLPGGSVAADFQLLVQSDAFTAIATRIAAVDGVAVLPIVFEGVRSGLRILLYCFVKSFASKLASLHVVFAQIAATLPHLPSYLGQALVMSPMDQTNYELLSSFSLPTAVITRLLQGEFAALFSDFNSTIYVPVYHALHGESVSAPSDPYARLLAVMQMLTLLFSAFGFDVNGPVGLSSVCMSALAVLDSAPEGSRLQYFAHVRDVLAQGFTLASARHQQFLAVLSVSSSSASSLFVASDALLEHLKSLEKLLFQNVFARVGRLSAAPPLSATVPASPELYSEL